MPSNTGSGDPFGSLIEQHAFEHASEHVAELKAKITQLEAERDARWPLIAVVLAFCLGLVCCDLAGSRAQHSLRLIRWAADRLENASQR
jgi:hypothetical protein